MFFIGEGVADLLQFIFLIVGVYYYIKSDALIGCGYFVWVWLNKRDVLIDCSISYGRGL